MPTRYRRSNAPDQSTIPPANLRSCSPPSVPDAISRRSTATSSSTSHPTELSELRDVWIAALSEYGAEPHRATAFVGREELSAFRDSGRGRAWPEIDIDVPSWLLMPHDFATNEYAPPFLKHCTDIVVAGRVKWIADSEHDGGFDNSCWYRFDINYDGEPVFHNDRKRQRQGNGKRQRRRATISTLTQEAAEAAP